MITTAFRFRYLSACVAAFIAISTLCAVAQISGGAPGRPVVATGSTTATSSQSYVDVAVYSTTGDFCARVSNAWNSFPIGTSGVVVDARGITGTQTCSSGNPFPNNASGHGVLLLGNVKVQTTIPWVIPSGVQVIGLGRSGSPTSTTPLLTSILAQSTFPTNTAVVQMGNDDGTPQWGVRVSNLTIDCNAVAGCTGLLNNTAQEGSMVDNIVVNNAPGIGVFVTTDTTTCTNCGGATNSGPYTNINIQYTNLAASTASTVGLMVTGLDNKKSIRAFQGITVSGAGLATTPLYGIFVNGISTRIVDVHVESFPTGIQIGSSSGVTTHAVEVENASIGVNLGGWNVTIASLAGDISVKGLTNGSPNNQILQDAVSGKTLTNADDSYLGLYVLGHGTSPAPCTAGGTYPVVMSSSPRVQWQAPCGVKTGP